jgi:hypothetical protein
VQFLRPLAFDMETTLNEITKWLGQSGLKVNNDKTDLFIQQAQCCPNTNKVGWL